MKKIRRKEHNL